jgi:hypothetical protein
LLAAERPVQQVRELSTASKGQQVNKGEDPGGGDDPIPATTCTSFTISVEPGTGYIHIN